jgi:hypothetical protein
MSKLIKRKDGSYSKRGLWDNIRANKGSGKKPTKEMLKQESKIKKEENMKSMYKKGGKKMKGESFMEESKEIGFDAPGVKPPKRRFDLGGLMDKDKPKEKQPTAPQPTLGSQLPAGLKALPTPSPEPKLRANLNTEERGPGKVMIMQQQAMQKKRGGMVETGMEANARKNRFEGEANMAGKKMMGGKMYKKGGKKTMEPGGGGRFAKMVSGLKKEGKSEDSAKAIAASIGRKKYGKSKFQEMAAAGKKKMGGKKC